MTGGFIGFKKHLRDLAISVLYVAGSSEESSIDGVALAGVGVGAKRLRGIAGVFAGTYFSEVKGMTFGGINHSDSVTGVQIGGFNKNDSASGV